MIVGCGPMGLLNLMLAKIRGAGQLIAVDIMQKRLSLARRIGATHTLNTGECDLEASIRRQTGGRGVDVVICAVPMPKLQQQLLNALAPFGRLCLFAGWPRGDATCELDTNPIHYRALTVTGTTGGSNRDYAAALRLIASGAIDVSQIISHVLHISRLEEAYRIAQNGNGMKIVLTADACREQEHP
jgi:L-iditol 2-dehydrogenase